MQPREVRCFLTGVSLAIEDSFVLRRSNAKWLIAQLQARLASLQNIIDQLGPLDDVVLAGVPTHAVRYRAPRHHRLICPAMAQTLSDSFPESELFEPWPDYRARAKTYCRNAPLQLAQQVDSNSPQSNSRRRKAFFRIVDPNGVIPGDLRKALVTLINGKWYSLAIEAAVTKLRDASLADEPSEELKFVTPEHFAALRQALAHQMRSHNQHISGGQL